MAWPKVRIAAIASQAGKSAVGVKLTHYPLPPPPHPASLLQPPPESLHEETELPSEKYVVVVVQLVWPFPQVALSQLPLLQK